MNVCDHHSPDEIALISGFGGITEFCLFPNALKEVFGVLPEPVSYSMKSVVTPRK
jgi:hypothetical protein